MSLYMYDRRDKVKWIITFILLAVLVVGLILTCVKFSNMESVSKVRTTAFEIGGLDASGAEIKNTGCIRMKNSISTDGLSILIDEDADITYKVFFYELDEDGKEVFISASDDLDAEFVASTVPAGADVCKVVITPIGDAEVSSLELVGYARQLTITYNK